MKITENDPEKISLNFSKYELSDAEKKLLAKGLNFSLAPTQLNYCHYLVQFELFYRNIRNLEVLSNEDLDLARRTCSFGKSKQKQRYCNSKV